jgi:hypothetical protein
MAVAMFHKAGTTHDNEMSTDRLRSWRELLA